MAGLLAPDSLLEVALFCQLAKATKLSRCISRQTKAAILVFLTFVVPRAVKSHFAKVNNFEEKDFYQFFGSFEAIENHVFKAFFDQTITLLEKSEEYVSFDARIREHYCSSRDLVQHHFGLTQGNVL